MGRFEKISPTGGSTAFQYYYNAASNETERTRLLNNVKQIYTPDSLNRMSRLDVKKGALPLSAEVYTYDRMSRLTVANRWPENKRDQFGYYLDGEMYWAQYGVTGPEVPEGGDPDLDMPDTTDSWAGWAGDPEAEGSPPPDGGGEPSSPVLPDAPEAVERWTSYLLDKTGNRTSIIDTGVTKSYVTNTLNQYTSAEGLGVSNGGEHEVSVYNNVSYLYINDERLKQVASGGNNYYLYYDALGRCVKRTRNNVTTFYIYDGEKPILEYNSAGTLVGRNLYGKGIDEILMRTYGNQTYYFQQDRNGNVTHLTSGAGAVVEKYKYDAFGAVTVYDGAGHPRPNGTAFNNRFLFTGREYAATYAGIYVPEFNFYEYRARAYNPTLGRFMSEDPIGFQIAGEKPAPPASLMFPTQLPKTFADSEFNLFRYCHNDPLDMTDPTGLEAGGPQSGDNPQIGPAVLLPIGSNIPVLAVRLANAQWVDYRAAGLTMGQVSQSGPKMFTYSLKSQYNIGDLSGARGFQYVWDPSEKFSGQCMTTVQCLSGAPSSTTPLLRGNAVGPNTKQGTAIAAGFELRNGQWVYPSKPSGNHAAFYVAPIGGGRMQTLEAQRGVSIHLERQSIAGWYEVISRLPPSTTSTSELRPSGGLYGPFY